MFRNAIHFTVALTLAVASAPAWGERAELPVTADVGISSVVGKMGLSNGVGPTTPIMQNQNWSGFENKNLLMAFDTRAIRGWTVGKAYMHVYLAKGELYGIGLCTMLADWREGRALNYVERRGAPCWNFRRTPAEGEKPTAEEYWAWPGSRFFSVSWSHPAARYSNAGPGQIQRSKTEDGRFVHLKFPVDPKLVESLSAGVASGLVLTDDKGQVRESYSLIGPAMPYRYNAAEDTWMFTKDIQVKELRPWLEVEGAAIDKAPPAAPAELKVAGVHAADGSALLTFTAPGDDGLKGEVLAYDAAYSEQPITEANWAQARQLPRWSLPEPVAAGKTQRMPVFTVPPGSYHLAVRGVDEAGNRGPLAGLSLTIPPKPPAKLLDVAVEFPRGEKAAAPGAGKLDVAVVPDMVLVEPVNGGVLRDGRGYKPEQEYLRENPIWRSETGTIYLTAAANEVAAFQVILGKKADKLSNVRVSVGDLTAPGGRSIAAAQAAQTFRLWYVRSGRSWSGTACLPLKKPFDESFDIPAADNKVPGQAHQSVWVDLWVPRGTAAGEYAGKVSIAADQLDRPATVTLRLKVLPLALPDKYTFVTELNRYHSVVGWAGVDARRDPQQADRTTRDYYALAHQHRSVLNVLPYSHSGRVDGDYVPVLTDERKVTASVRDWTAWDRRFGPLLDGSGFSPEAGYFGPGAGVPINHMYTAFHEAWPVGLDASTYKDWMAVSNRLQFAEYAKKSRRPELAFTAAYKRGFMRVAGQFFRHFKEKGWTRTSLHFYNNNKYYWKVAYFGGMGTGGVCFWLMDEPTDFDDYDTNRFVMGLGRQAYEAAGTPEVRMDGRVDVSQPDMARGLWDNVGTVWCIGGLRGYSTMTVARRRWLPGEKHWCYGGGVGVGSAPVGMSQSALLRWSFGASGWMPWWDTFRGTGAAWSRGDDLAIYYSGSNYANSRKSYPGPIASVRLKMLRRVQQDVEYLHLLAGRAGWDRDRVRLALAGYCDDADEPLWRFSNLTQEKMDEIRRRVAATILAEKE